MPTNMPDSELDDMLTWNTAQEDGMERVHHVIAELRALREQLQDVEDAIVGADVDIAGESLADGVRRLREQNAALIVYRDAYRQEAAQNYAALDAQNAALVTALELAAKHWRCAGPPCETCNEVQRVLARVRGAE